MLKESHIFSAGYKLSTLERRGTSDELYILLHGWEDNSGSFIPLIHKLNPEYHLLAIDMLGHGQSEHISGQSFYHFDDFIDILQGIIQQQHNKKITLIGHSFGGFIAFIYTAFFTPKIKNLILIESAGPYSISDNMLLNTHHEAQICRQQYRQNPSYHHHDNIEDLISLRAKKNQVAPSMMQYIVRRGVKLQEEGYIWSHDKKLDYIMGSKFTRTSIRQAAQQISCHTLFILGSAGNPKMRTYAKERSQEMPDAQVFCIEGGHYIHLELPEKVAEIIYKNPQQPRL